MDSDDYTFNPALARAARLSSFPIDDPLPSYSIDDRPPITLGSSLDVAAIDDRVDRDATVLLNAARLVAKNDDYAALFQALLDAELRS